MNYPIDQLSAESRVWLFFASRKFSEQESAFVISESSAFLESWLAHKQDLKAGLELLHNQVLLIAVDENEAGASGCSIDKLHQFIKNIETQLSLALLDRMRIIYKEGNNFLNISVGELQNLIKEKKITSDTIVCNSMISSLSEMKNNFEIPLSKTWMSRFLASAPV